MHRTIASIMLLAALATIVVHAATPPALVNYQGVETGQQINLLYAAHYRVDD